jgi:hypothetical protein
MTTCKQYEEAAKLDLIRLGYREYSTPRRCRECGVLYYRLHETGLCQPCCIQELKKRGKLTEMVSTAESEADVAAVGESPRTTDKASEIARIQAECRKQGTITGDW